MNARTKSALLLLGTLLIGMVLGALLNARLAEERMERIASLRSQRGFTRFMHDVIEPHDADQEAAVRAILSRTAERLHEVGQQRRHQIAAIMDSTRDQLDDVLTDEQMQRLEERLQTRPRGPFGRHRGPHRGPPPP